METPRLVIESNPLYFERSNGLNGSGDTRIPQLRHFMGAVIPKEELRFFLISIGY